MPKVRRSNVPKRLFAHLLARIAERSTDAEALESLAAWLDKDPEVPEGDWYKRFPTMTVCGRGTLIRTFLTSAQTPVGEEL